MVDSKTLTKYMTFILKVIIFTSVLELSIILKAKISLFSDQKKLICIYV